MSGDDDDLDLGLDLDLDDALDAWEKEFEDSAQAESAPMPQSLPPAPPPPPAPPADPKAKGRPLYVPDPELAARAAEARAKKKATVESPAAKRPTKESKAAVREKFPSFADDDGSEESTAIAQVPDDLISSLQELRKGDGGGTAPKPAEPGGFQEAVELDLDDLFGDEHEHETRISAVPETPKPPKPVSDAPAAKPKPMPVPKPAAPKPAAPPPPMAAAKRPPPPPPPSAFKLKSPAQLGPIGGDDDEDDLLDPFEDADDALDDLIFGGGAEDALEASVDEPAVSAPPAPSLPSSDRDDEPTMQVALEDPHRRQTVPPDSGEAGDRVTLEPSGDEVDAPAPPVADDALEIEFGEPAADDDEPALEFGEPDDEPALEIGAPDDEPALEIGAPDDDEPALEIGAVDDDGPALEIGAVDDDDEPALEIGAVDDDEPALEFGDDDDGPALEFGDDDEPALEFGDDDAEPALEFDDADGAELAAAAGSDAPGPSGPSGAAATARRTVGHRKLRDEKFAFLGRGPEVLGRRAALLERLAESGPEPGRARSLMAAAEIRESLGEHDAALALVQRAYEANPRDLLVLRALRRAAMRQGDWSAVAERLQEEAALPLSPVDKSLCLTLLAEVLLSKLDDAEGAEKACRASMAAHPSVAAGLLWAEASTAMGRGLGGAIAVQKTAAAWKDDHAASTLLLGIARAAERTKQRPRALALYREAMERTPSVGGAMGVARLAPPAERADALAVLAEQWQDPGLAEATRRASARASLRANVTEGVAERLQDATRPSTLRTLARVHRRAADAGADTGSEGHQDALQRLAEATGGTERALALVELAELHASRDDVPAADAALREAAVADGTLDTVRVVRELLSRRVGDPTLLAPPTDDAPTEGTAIETAAKLANGDREQERAYLRRAFDRGEAPLATSVLLLDAAAGAGDPEAVLERLRQAVARLAPQRRLGALLALAARAPDEEARRTLELASEEGGAPARRVLVRKDRAGAPAAAAAQLTATAEATSGEAAFFAWVEAGRAHRDAGDLDAAIAAWRRAAEEVPGSSPATWELESAYAEKGDLAALEALTEEILDTGHTAAESAVAAVRLAFARGGDGAMLEQAREHLERANVQDPVLESMLAVASGTDPHALARFFEQRAEEATERETRRAHTFRAGSAYESAGDHAAAATLYRKLYEREPDRMTAAALERAELAAGQHARVGERRFAAVKAAQHPAIKLAALEDLAALDLYERGDMTSAVLTLQSILEEVPGHLPTLRILERHFMTEDRDEELLRVVRRLSEHLALRDGFVAARLAVRLVLRSADTQATTADPILEALLTRLKDEWPEGESWVARRVLAIRSEGPVVVRAWNAMIQNVTASDAEQAAFVLRAAEATSQAEPGEAAAMLGPAVAALPNHPLLAETQARAHLADGEKMQAAEAFETAAEASHLPAHAVTLLYEAGRALEESGESERALVAFERASELDVTYADLFERTRRMLESGGHHGRLAELTQRRLDAGGDAATLVELHETHARLAIDAGDRSAAREALRRALALEPNRIATLRKLAELSLEEEDHRSAAETLIKIARLRQDREELRWVFFTLGDLYDRHMPDPRRAEAAFARVLKLVPEDLEAMDRLAELYVRESMWDKAVATLTRLHDMEIDPDEKKRHRLRLARVHEQRGDARTAERVLDETRRADPTDLQVLKAMADLYQRQNAPSALAMHLGRALTDFRHLIDQSPTDPFAWSGLVEVLDWKGQPDASRAAASAAIAYGVTDLGLAQRVGPAGEIPGAGVGAHDAELRDLLAPPRLSRAVFEVFRLANDAFERAVPFDPKAWRASRVKNDPLLAEARQVGAFFGAGDVQLLVTAAAPRLCLPVGSSPVTLLIGEDLGSGTTPAQRAFLFARAIAVASAHLTVAMRTQPEQLAPTLLALQRQFDPHVATAGVDARVLEDLTKKVGKGIARRSRDALGLVLLEMVNAPGYDPTRLGIAAAELGDRLALLALGSAPAAIEALLQLAGIGDAAPRHQLIAKVPEARELLRFAVSDPYFDARVRAGASRS